MQPGKPSENEEEYFNRLEVERKRQWEKDRQSNMDVAEKQRLKELHYMKCPNCGMDLHEFPFHGVKVHRCVSCHGTFVNEAEMNDLLHHEQSLLSQFKALFGFEENEI